MTRTFNGRVHCPHCRQWHTAETALERWIRDAEDLDSRIKGIVRFDCDILLHRYLVPVDKRGTRDLQCVMFIEAKTHWADMTPAQKDTLSMLSQVIRNRRRNIHGAKKGRHAQDRTPPCKCYSHVLKKDVRLWLFGGHVLRMSGDCPDDSDRMAWDGKPIDRDTLIRVLRFELDPDDIAKAIDWRRRYSAFDALRSQRLLEAMFHD